MQLPGRNHFLILLHLLHHVRCDHNTGTKFYSDVTESPLAKYLEKAQVDVKNMLVLVTDSSWQDCPDTGRSTGGFLSFYQGGIVDDGSVTPDPVAMSSAEAEYNQACVRTMRMSHTRQLVAEMHGLSTEEPWAVPLLLDNTAAISIGNSFRDTAHNRHILRRYHYVRQQVSLGFIHMHYIPTEYMLADPLTKALPASALTMKNFREATEVHVDA
jgi:hypothetical protein